MKYIILFSLIVFIIFSCITTPQKTVVENKEPEKKSFFPYDPPAGFDWRFIDESSSWILQPQNWSYNKQIKDGVVGVFMTKKSTKITINIIRDQKKPGAYTEEIHSNFIKQNEVIETYKKNDGRFIISRSMIRMKKDDFFIRILLETRINQKTNSIYIIIYETPEKEWKTNWPVFDTLINNMNLSMAF